MPDGSDVLEYCEPGNDAFEGFSPEQYTFSQTGVNRETLNLFGWLFGGGDRKGELPYKLIRSIIVCGEHHQSQVEFSAYVAYNKLSGKLRNAGRFTPDDAVVIEILPTGDSSNDDPSRFDPQGFASYCQRHALFPTWKRCFVSTCIEETGRTAFGQVVPEKTERGALVDRCFYHSDSQTPPRKNSELVCQSVVAAMQSLLARLQGPSCPTGALSSGALVLGGFLGVQLANLDRATRNVQVLAGKSLLSHPRLRARLQQEIKCTVGFELRVEAALRFVTLHECASNVKEEPASVERSVLNLAVAISSDTLESGQKKLCEGLMEQVNGSYRVTTITNHFEKNGVYLFLFSYKNKGNRTYKHWALASKKDYEEYQESLKQTGASFDRSKFLIVSNEVPLSMADVGNIGDPSLRWYAVSDRTWKKDQKGASVETIADLKCFKIPKANFRSARVSELINGDEIERFRESQRAMTDVEAAWVRNTREYEGKQDEVAIRFIDCLSSKFGNILDSPMKRRLLALRDRYIALFKDWILIPQGFQINFQRSVGFHMVDRELFKLQGQWLCDLQVEGSKFSELFFPDPRPIPYSCLDDCVVGYHTDTPSLQPFKGFRFQALPLSTNPRIKPSKWFVYLHALLISFRYVAKNNQELFQFAQLNTMQITLLNNWYRFLNVQYIRTYIEDFALQQLNQSISLSSTDSEDESKIKRAIAQALNIRIVEFTLRDDLELDNEQKAFDIGGCVEFTPDTNCMDPFWLPNGTDKEQNTENVESVFELKGNIARLIEEDTKKLAEMRAHGEKDGGLGNRIKRRGRMIPIQPITVYLLNMENLTRADDALPLLQHLQEQSPEVRSRFGNGLHQYRTLLGTGFDVGFTSSEILKDESGVCDFKVLNRQVFNGGVKLTETLRYSTSKGCLARVADLEVMSPYDSFPGHFQTVHGRKRSIFESGWHGMLRSIQQCLRHYATNKYNQSVFDSEAEMMFFREYSEGSLTSTVSWQGVLNPGSFNFETFTKFADFFRTNKIFEEEKYKVNADFKFKLAGFMRRCSVTKENHVEISEDDKAYSINYLGDLQVLGAIFNLRFVIVKACGVSDCNSLYCEPCAQMSAISHVSVPGRLETHERINYFNLHQTRNSISTSDEKAPDPLVIMLYPQPMYTDGAIRVYWNPVLKDGDFDHATNQTEAEKQFQKPSFQVGPQWKIVNKPLAETIRPGAQDRDENDTGRVERPRVKPPDRDRPDGKEDKKDGSTVVPWDSGQATGGGGGGGKGKGKKSKGKAATGPGQGSGGGWGGGGGGGPKPSYDYTPSTVKNANGIHGNTCIYEKGSKGPRQGKGGYRRSDERAFKRDKESRQTKSKRQWAEEQGINTYQANSSGGGGGSTQPNKDKGGYSQVSRDKMSGRQQVAYNRAKKFQEEQMWWEQQTFHSPEETRRHNETVTEREQFEQDYSSELDYLTKKKLLDLNSVFPSDNYPGPVLSCNSSHCADSFSSRLTLLGEAFSLDNAEHWRTFAQGKEKETFFLTAALGQTAGIVRVLADKGWATFKIHTGQTEQSRYLARMLYPFFDDLDCYPISKQYTAHILVVGVGFRRDLAQQINLSELILSCGSIDAKEMRMVCEVIEDFAYRHSAVSREAYAAYKDKVYRTSSKMYFDWFAHSMTISRVYVQSTLEGRVTPAPNYLRPEIADLLNQRVFDRVSKETRARNLQVLRTIMATPLGEQLKPFFVFAPHPGGLGVVCKSLRSPGFPARIELVDSFEKMPEDCSEDESDGDESSDWSDD